MKPVTHLLLAAPANVRLPLGYRLPLARATDHPRYSVVGGSFSMFARILLLSFGLVCAAFPAHAARHALLIGISDYGGSGFANLDGTLNDVNLVRGVLIERFGFAAGEIRVLTNETASHSGIQNAFAELAQRVGKDDLVYIHYSGHGSYTPDLNGDEKARASDESAFDSTWVSFGARVKGDAAGGRGGRSELDGFDILDDELGAWLAPIYAKTGNVAFVSDSCHSGSVTRGAAPKVRAIPIDLRPHPRGQETFVRPLLAGVRIGAARDDQQAGEYGGDDGKTYGLFTWYWVQALARSTPGESWEEVFKRTLSLIGSTRENKQHPQLEGEGRRAMFGAAFLAPQQTVAVSAVDEPSREVMLKSGTFQGVTVGSLYAKKGGGAPASFEITAAEPFRSVGKLRAGSFVAGDLAVEETHVYPYAPLKVFLHAEQTADAALASALSKVVAGLPGYAVVAQQHEADLLLWILHPLRRAGVPVKSAPAQTLPDADPQAAAELWLLTPQEELLREKDLQWLIVSPAQIEELLATNLRKMARIRELKALGASGNAASAPAELSVTRYRPDAQCRGSLPACLEVPTVGKFRALESVPAVQMQDMRLQLGDLLTFTVKNTGASDIYCYLLDITPKGQIAAIFPGPDDSSNAVLLPGGKERNFADLAGMLIEEPGEDTVKLIVSQQPLDVSLFEQGAFTTRGLKGAGSNPLQEFLGQSLGGLTRGRIATSARTSQWGTVQFSFQGQ